MFDEVLAQEKAQEIITNFIKAGRLPQSLIFYGPRGVGKFLMAKSIVKYFNCPNTDKKSRGLDNCNLCSRIDREIYPDMTVVRTEKTVTKSGQEKDSKEIKIDQIREVVKKAQFKPFEGENKFYIIDGAEAMNTVSENSFLKTLEEPLPNNYIILICHNINKILPTIFSRCIKIKFDSIKEDFLKKIIKKQFEIEDSLAEKLSLLSNGSIYNAGILIEDDMYKDIFKILESIIKIISAGIIDIDELFSISAKIKGMEIQYIDYLLDLLLLFLNESYIMSLQNIKRKEFFKYYLNFKAKSIKLKSFNNIVDDLLKSKYYLLNTNVDTKLLIENFIIKARENLS